MEVVDELGKITIMKNGKEVECDILFTFDNDELQKQYVGYTDHSMLIVLILYQKIKC